VETREREKEEKVGASIYMGAAPRHGLGDGDEVAMGFTGDKLRAPTGCRRMGYDRSFDFGPSCVARERSRKW